MITRRRNRRRLPRLLVSVLIVLGTGALAALILVDFRSREPAPGMEPVVVAPAPATQPLKWVKKSGPEFNGSLTVEDELRRQHGTLTTTPQQNNGWGRLGQGGWPAPGKYDPPMTANEQERYEANRKAVLDESLRSLKQASADAETRRVAEAQRAELLAKQAEQEKLANERWLLEQALLGGDPTGLPFFETSRTGGPANLAVCNQSSYRIKVGVVRSNQAYLGLWGSPWIADGFHSLSSGCRRFNFGVGKALAHGYISIFQEDSGGRWHSLTYDDRKPNSAMKATLGTRSNWICWPQTATDVDPSVDCPDSNRNILFGLGFSTSGHVANFTITVTDEGLSQHVSQY